MTHHLELRHLLAIADRVCDGDVQVRDHGLLESALARPRATVFGQDAYPDLHVKAAALMHSLCTNQALVDGNKRLAAGAAIVFLDINGALPEKSIDEWFDLTMSIAAGTVGDLEKIAGRLR